MQMVDNSLGFETMRTLLGRLATEHRHTHARRQAGRLAYLNEAVKTKGLTNFHKQLTTAFFSALCFSVFSINSRWFIDSVRVQLSFAFSVFIYEQRRTKWNKQQQYQQCWRRRTYHLLSNVRTKNPMIWPNRLKIRHCIGYLCRIDKQHQRKQTVCRIDDNKCSS